MQTIYLCALVFPRLSITVLSWSCEPPILGKGRPYGVGDGAVRNSVGEFLPIGRYSNFSSICRPTNFRDIPLIFSSTSLFPYPTVPTLVSPKFPHVPLGIGGSPFRYKEQRCWAIVVCAISFPDFQPM